jgi:hypothetical protein
MSGNGEVQVVQMLFHVASTCPPCGRHLSFESTRRADPLVTYAPTASRLDRILDGNSPASRRRDAPFPPAIVLAYPSHGAALQPALTSSRRGQELDPSRDEWMR